MRTHVLAVLAALLLLMALGAGTAAAGEPLQVVGQDASSQQAASSNANATQVKPSNDNTDVRIFSPGNSGDVQQTNAAGALAIAGNANQTSQSASQDQSGAGTQAAGQDASSHQSAEADADATQIAPSNENISVRIKSPGNDGDVTQTNAAGAAAVAGNANGTSQTADQSQGGGDCKCHGGGGTQAVGQDASNKQSADADANATQIKPSNSNISVRIGSPGNGGNVTQTNAALGVAAAGNLNDTTQSVGQGQGGSGVQAVGQDASNHQSAKANADAVQYKPSNENTSVRIGSAGDDGDVTQTNLAAAVGIAGNANLLEQSVEQSQGGGDAKCGCGGTPVQAVGQFADSKQSADADATAKQIKPSNSNTPVRIGSAGGSGSVTQTNAAVAGALAGNLNLTSQSTTQSQAGSGGGVQAVGQDASSKQWADADATAFQFKPTNTNTPVSIGADGHGKKHECGCEDTKSVGGSGGDVTQTNLAGALGVAGNANVLEQSADQSQGGGMDAKCGCYGKGGIQAVGQSAWNGQFADADATAKQIAPSNTNAPVNIGSAGSSGSVTQTNAALAGALAGNLNLTGQSATQSQGGAGGVQAIGQDASNKQWADADATAFQFKPTNTNTPVSIAGGHGKKHECGCEDTKSVGGSGGDVTQTNLAGALGIAGNANVLEQSADQSQAGGMDAKCGCHGKGGIQAIGQDAGSKQWADADATAFQFKPTNTNAPVNIGSAGSSGSVTQTNAALAGALAGNLNLTGQSATQSQGGAGGLQAIGQDAGNYQSADADATAFQFKPTNTNTPVSIGADGHGKKHQCGCDDTKHVGGSGGDVTQTNLAAAAGIALNANLLDQSADQSQGGADVKCGCDGKGDYGKEGYGKDGYGKDGYGKDGHDKGGYGKDGYAHGGTQAIGQSAWNKQHADASANAGQLWAANDNTPVRVGSAGNGGNVTQTNAALAFSLAANLNALDQEATQQQ